MVGDSKDTRSLGENGVVELNSCSSSSLCSRYSWLNKDLNGEEVFGLLASDKQIAQCWHQLL